MSLVRATGIGALVVVAFMPRAWALDGGPIDAGAFDSGKVDSGTDSGTCTAGSGLSCEQCNVSGYTPSTMAPPITPSAMTCADADISGFITACIDPGTSSQTACATWQMSAPPACTACIITQDTASTWGPLVCNTSTCMYNVPGCIDLTLNQVSLEKNMGGSGSCGDLLSADYGCQDYACGTCSTMTTDFQNCANSAIMNECASYAAPVQSMMGPCAAIDGSASETSCFLQAGDSDVQALVTLFCGGAVPPPPDAGGSDSGTTTMDAGKPDSGTTKDAGGGNKDGGSDAGSSGATGSAGCHCDAAGGGAGTSTLVLVGLAGLVGLTASRRRRRA